MSCEELLVELQGRQGEFEDRNAKLVVLGSLPEELDVTESKVAEHKITYPLLHDAEASVTKRIGLWSEMMEMPWMGYLIIDKSGRVAASDLQLSEAKDAGPANVDEILASLERAQQAEAVGGLSQATP